MTEDKFEKYSTEEWEHLRKRFFNSILNDTEIAKLGQNVSITWPFKGSDETPTKYIEYTFEELQAVPGLVGKTKRIHILMDILRETLAFDDPFSDMVDTVEAESQEDDTFERILAKLNIPTTYPSTLVHFTPDTKELLKNEDLKTLLEVIHFGQKLARSVVVGGDLKSFLNGLAHKDEVGISKHIPYRRGERGLHLAEAIGLIAADLDAPIQLELLRRTGIGLTEEETQQVASVSQAKLEATLKEALEQVAAVCQWFTAEATDLEQVFATGGSPERYFIMINDPRRERMALVLARMQYGIDDSGKGGLFGKISGLFGR
jgi:hypothetical protein